VTKPPTISVVTVLCNPEISQLRECLRSAKAPGVEHILSFSAIPSGHTLRAVKRLSKNFGASLIINDKILEFYDAANIAVNEASAPLIVFLNERDRLEQGWFGPIHLALKSAHVVYCDSFTADENMKVTAIESRPKWSPVRLMFNMYLGRVLGVRKQTFNQVGGFRPGFNGAEDYDFVLRASRTNFRFEHVPLTLYTTCGRLGSELQNGTPVDQILEAKLRASQYHIRQLSSAATVREISNSPGSFRAEFGNRVSPVSIVIPTAFKRSSDGFAYVSALVDSLAPFLNHELGDEVIIVHGGEEDHGLLVSLAQIFGKSGTIKQVIDSETFNFSRRCNMGFIAATHGHVLLLNDDLVFGTLNPLDTLFGLLALPGVGLVGGLLKFPDGSIQHGGHTFVSAVPDHIGRGLTEIEPCMIDLIIDHEVVGVTGALMFQLKETWEAVGGFSLSLPLSYNDVDYCQKIRTLGLSIIQANSVIAVHHESATRSPEIEDWELDILTKRWPGMMASDGYSTHSLFP